MASCPSAEVQVKVAMAACLVVVLNMELRVPVSHECKAQASHAN